MNPALIEMAAKDRLAELRRAAPKRSLRAARSVTDEIAAPHPTPRSSRRVHLANPQQAIGWFLISAGLRLAVPRTRTGSAR